MHSKWMIIPIVALVVFALPLRPAVVRAQDPEVTIRQPLTRLSAVGRDATVGVAITLPASCAGSDVTVALFQNGGAARVNQPDPLFEPVSARVNADGSVLGQVRLPAKLPSGLKTLWPGVTGACLKSPFVSFAPGLLFGVIDLLENPGTSATFVVPRASLFMGRSEQVVSGSLTAFADDVQCTVVSLEDSKAKDVDGNVRIHVGGLSQPSACSRQGAVVSFRYPNGALLFERRELVLGVTQPFENLAPEAVPATSGTANSTPQPPNVGQSVVRPSEQEYVGREGFLTRAALVALGLALTVTLFFRARRGGSKDTRA